MSLRVPVLFMGLFLMATRLLALPVWQWTAPPADSLMLGKPLTLSYAMLNAAEFDELALPQVPAGWILHAVDSTRQSENAGAFALERTLTLIPFSLDPCTLLVSGPVPSGPLQMILQVPARLEQGAAPAELIGPLAITRGFLGWLKKLWPWLAGLFLLAGLYWLYRRTRMGNDAFTRTVEVPVIDPWERFITEWTRIEEEALDTCGRMDEHYASISLALRGLVEDATGLPCRERTTLELERMEKPGRLSARAWQELLCLLEANDSVKYARQWPDSASSKAATKACFNWAREQKAMLLATQVDGSRL
jgi:hypothetical protein